MSDPHNLDEVYQQTRTATDAWQQAHLDEAMGVVNTGGKGTVQNPFVTLSVAGPRTPDTGGTTIFPPAQSGSGESLAPTMPG